VWTRARPHSGGLAERWTGKYFPPSSLDYRPALLRVNRERSPPADKAW
jgi:hypothetical protein